MVAEVLCILDKTHTPGMVKGKLFQIFKTNILASKWNIFIVTALTCALVLPFRGSGEKPKFRQPFGNTCSAEDVKNEISPLGLALNLIQGFGVNIPNLTLSLMYNSLLYEQETLPAVPGTAIFAAVAKLHQRERQCNT